MVILILGFLGLCLGSFINALVYRLRWQETNSKRTKKYSILKGRSICPNCKHELAPKDLIPVFSWFLLNGKCRYCREPISIQYPLVEAVTAGLFVLSYVFWPPQFIGGNILVFLIWLGVLVGLIALAVYDIRWMILPNKIIFPLYILVAAFILTQFILTPDYNLIVSSLWGVLIGGGIFYILFQVSGGKWIGGGDVKLGFLLGAIAGGPVMAFLMLFIASLLGSVFSIPLILKNRLATKSKIAFGPFLILAAVIVQLFGVSILDWYTNMYEV